MPCWGEEKTLRSLTNFYFSRGWRWKVAFWNLTFSDLHLMKLIEIQNRVGDFSFLSIKYIFSEFENNKILIEWNVVICWIWKVFTWINYLSVICEIFNNLKIFTDFLCPVSFFLLCPCKWKLKNIFFLIPKIF